MTEGRVLLLVRGEKCHKHLLEFVFRGRNEQIYA